MPKNGEGKILDGQKAITGVADRLGILMGENLSVAPEVITLEQLNSGQYQGKRVQVQKIHFTETNNSAVWLGTHAITDNERTGYVLTLEGAAFKNSDPSSQPTFRYWGSGSP